MPAAQSEDSLESAGGRGRAGMPNASDHQQEDETSTCLLDDDVEDDEDELYNTLRKKNILEEDHTRDGYRGCMKQLRSLWLIDNLPEMLDQKCISSFEDIRIRDNDEKTKQSMMNESALEC